MYLELNKIKKHLNIDLDYTDDDEYLMDLASVVETVVEKHIDRYLNTIAEANGGVLPSPLLHAMLLLLGNFYANRESVAFASAAEIPLSYSYLLDLYKNYSNNMGLPEGEILYNGGMKLTDVMENVGVSVVEPSEIINQGSSNQPTPVRASNKNTTGRILTEEELIQTLGLRKVQ